MKSGLLMSHGRKNSVRDTGIGKKWVYLERNTVPSEGRGEGDWLQGMGAVVFIEVGNFTG